VLPKKHFTQWAYWRPERAKMALFSPPGLTTQNIEISGEFGACAIDVERAIVSQTTTPAIFLGRNL
jgi:hypothetical protein